MRISHAPSVITKRFSTPRKEDSENVTDTGIGGSLHRKQAKFKSPASVWISKPFRANQSTEVPLKTDEQIVSSIKVSTGVRKRSLETDAKDLQLPDEGRDQVEFAERTTKRFCEDQHFHGIGFGGILEEAYQLLPEVNGKNEQQLFTGTLDQRTSSSLQSDSRARELDESSFESENQTGDSVGRTQSRLHTDWSHSAPKKVPINSKFIMPARDGSVCGVPKVSELRYNVPQLSHSPGRSSKLPSKRGKANESRWNVEENVQSDFFCVMYCTRKPNAKHKGPWSDGVLIRRVQSSVLQDSEGNVISTDGIPRCADLSDGAALIMGKFEVEVMRRSTEEEFQSGRIFQEPTNAPCDAAVKVIRKRTFKSFRTPVIRQDRDGKVIVPLGVHSVQVNPVVGKDELVLNAIDPRAGVPVIVDSYLALKLRPHQREGVRFMYECVMGLRNSSFTGCLLADAMGLGKTLQVIALIWTLIKQGPRGHPAVERVLVICPSSLVENWGKEVKKWLGNERLTALIVHSGTSARDVKRKLSCFQVGKVYHLLITSYELLRKYKDDIKSAKPGLLVCDEAHRLKNCAGNKTIDALLDLKCSMRLILTGTPIQNDLMEFYAMIDFVNPNLLGSLGSFKRMYADPVEKSRDRDASEEDKTLGHARSAELQSKTRFCILQRSADINSKYLPPKAEFVVFCKLQPPQVALYQDFLRSKLINDVLVTGQSAVVLSAIGTLRKLCNHPKLVEHELSKRNGKSLSCGNTEFVGALSEKPSRSQEKTSGDWSVAGKLACLHRLLLAVQESRRSETRDKTVVVSNFTQTLDIIQKMCEGQGWKCLRLDGSTDVSGRQALVDRFNVNYNEETVFLLSSKAGGAGLNLIGANRLVLFDPDWNPATDAQAMARVWRDGQKKEVVIYRLLTTGSIEEKIYQRQIMKGEVAAAVEEHVEGQLGGGGGGRHFNRHELRELFTLHLDTRCDTYDLLTRSNSSHAESWMDYSNEVEDHALREVIETGLVTFVHKNIDKKDIKSYFDNPRDDEKLEEPAGLDSNQPDVFSIPSPVLIDDMDESPLGRDVQNANSTESEDRNIINHEEVLVPLNGSNESMSKSEKINVDMEHDMDTDANSTDLSPTPIQVGRDVLDWRPENKVNKILQRFVELPGITEHDADEVEALDAPFICTIDLEMELKNASFASEDLWEGFKLFAVGFLFDSMDERVSYRNSKLGMILERCNVDKTTDDESIFCKGLPLVRAVLERRHGPQAADLSHIFKCYEREGDLMETSKGRSIIDLIGRFEKAERRRVVTIE